MKKLTIPQAIMFHLIDNKGSWIPGWALEKVTLHGKWTGTSASRRARELAEDGSYILDGTKYEIESKIEGKFVYYRVTSGTRTVQKTTFNENPDGSRSVSIKLETVVV